MSTLSSFGVLNFGDEQQLAHWQFAHDLRHRTERLAISRLGMSLSPSDLTGGIDMVWFGRHYLYHLGINQALTKHFKVSAAPMVADISAPWQDEAGSFDTWHRAHNTIHQYIDSLLGINSNAGT